MKKIKNEKTGSRGPVDFSTLHSFFALLFKRLFTSLPIPQQLRLFIQDIWNLRINQSCVQR